MTVGLHYTRRILSLCLSFSLWCRLDRQKVAKWTHVHERRARIRTIYCVILIDNLPPRVYNLGRDTRLTRFDYYRVVATLTFNLTVRAMNRARGPCR